MDNGKGGQPKRGQKGKLKKIKAKYRDQDEEEREMRMQLLQVRKAKEGNREHYYFLLFSLYIFKE